MSQRESKYSVELFDPDGTLIADLTGRAFQRKLTKSRNEADELYLRLDLNDFEEYCRVRNISPNTLLVTGYTEVRFRRGEDYLSGGQLIYTNSVLEDGGNSIELRAIGFLNLFKDRFTAAVRTFVATQATTIAWTLIDESQALPNGDFGVTQGALETAGTHDIIYKRTNLKDALQNLTERDTSAFDMEFTYDKVFNAYVSIGADRPDIIYEYPGNIKQVSVPNDATNIANEVTALGSGNGDEVQAAITASDTNSQTTYKLRQKIVVTNGTDDSNGGVTDAANSELTSWAYPYELPQIVVDGNKAPFITDYGIGDRIRVRIQNHPMLGHIDGLYRLERFDLNVDDEDNEEIKLYLAI